MKIIRSPLSLVFLWLLTTFAKAQAVNPLPDGGYPGGNTAEGQNALLNLTTGRYNTAVGLESLKSNTVGLYNTAVGAHALMNHTNARHCTAIGKDALMRSTGNGNTALGANAGMGVTTANSVICIGANVDGQNIDNSCFIGRIYSNVQPIVGTDPDSVTITSAGRLGRGNVSSRRYKHDIKPIEKVSEVLYSLKPVSFRYNKEYDATQTLAFGLIAEDVAEAAPDLVGRNPNGEPESVRYEQINAMLLNEFLKEHLRVQEYGAMITELKSNAAAQEATIAHLQKQIDVLTVGLQNVTARLELSNTASQTVLNDR